ncbi:MAG: hypothetical protein QW796_05980 [Thermoproteota archaeon]
MAKPLEYLWVFLTRIRLVFALSALAVSISMVSLASRGGFQWGVVYGSMEGWVLCDYMVWLATLLACLAAYLDLRTMWNKHSYVSTILLTLTGLAVTVLGRIGSFILNVSSGVPVYVGPLLGSQYTQEGFLFAAFCLVSGSTVTSIALLTHTLLGRPIILRQSETLGQLLKKPRTRFSKAWEELWSSPSLFLIVAFLVGFIQRLIPEIIWWPWPVGWDTVEYIAHLKDFTVSLNPFTPYYWMGGMRNCPPLLNILLLPLSATMGAWNAFKVFPPIAYGLLTLSSALWAKRSLRLDGFGCFLTSAVTAFYVLNLRISAEYQRQILGSVFMMLALAAMDSWRRLDNRRMLAVVPLTVCCALSHEVTGLFSAAVSLVLIVKSLGEGDYRGLTAGLIGLSASVLLETWYWRTPYTPSRIFGVVPAGLVSYSANEPPAVLSFLLAGYGFTLPFAIAALLQPGGSTTYAKAGMVALMLAGVSPMIAPYTSAATWYRFLIGAAPIVSTLAGAGVYMLNGDKRLHAAYLILMIIPALAFTFSIGSLSRFAGALREFQSGFTPSPSGTQELNDLKRLAEWLESRSGNSTIAVESSLVGWIHMGVRNPTPSSLISVRGSVTGELLFTLFEKAEVERLYVVSTQTLVVDENLSVETLRERVFKVYLVESVKPVDPRDNGRCS